MPSSEAATQALALREDKKLVIIRDRGERVSERQEEMAIWVRVPFTKTEIDIVAAWRRFRVSGMSEGNPVAEQRVKKYASFATPVAPAAVKPSMTLLEEMILAPEASARRVDQARRDEAKDRERQLREHKALQLLQQQDANNKEETALDRLLSIGLSKKGEGKSAIVAGAIIADKISSDQKLGKEASEKAFTHYRANTCMSCGLRLKIETLRDKRCVKCGFTVALRYSDGDERTLTMRFPHSLTTCTACEKHGLGAGQTAPTKPTKPKSRKFRK